VLAVALCLEQMIDHTVIYYLVHITTIGMDHYQPPQFSIIDPRYYHTYTNLFFWWSILSGMVAVINWAILVRLARQWPMGFKRRLMWIILLISGIAAASAFIFWIYTRGLKEISPYFAESLNEAPTDYWLSAAVLFIVLVTIITYKLAVDRGQTANMPIIQWRRNPNKYYHEWRTILMLLTIAAAFCFLNALNLLRMLVSQILRGEFPGPFNSWTDWAYIFCGLFGMWCALILLALHRAFARRKAPEHLQSDLPRINPAKFITVWIATAAFAVSGALVLVWMSFAFWFNPWWIYIGN
jgi:hypothetical protein